MLVDDLHLDTVIEARAKKEQAAKLNIIKQNDPRKIGIVTMVKEFFKSEDEPDG